MHNYIIDIDGTVIQNQEEINHSSQFINHLKKRELDFIFTTNSILNKSAQVEKLKSINIHVNTSQIYSPIDSINDLLKQQSIQRALIIGSLLEIEQINCIQELNHPEIIILLDFEKNNTGYNELQRIVDFSEQGIRVISASGSPFYFSNNKKQIDTGAFVSLIESITQTKIDILGKPSDAFLNNANNTLPNNQRPTLIIGDDYQTDINGGKSVNFKTALVKTGKYVLGNEDLCHPDYLLNNLLELI